jgi:hypothetical protein
MHRTVMSATEGDRKLIADLAAERTRLRESEVVWVRGLATAQEARLLGDVAQMLPVPIATRRSNARMLLSMPSIAGGSRVSVAIT